MKNGVFWDIMRCGILRTDVSEDRSASIIRVTRIGELGTLAATSNRSKQYFFPACFSCLLLLTFLAHQVL
jgi:hypothetical protein